MCGHLKAILADINKLSSDAIEAFTSPPVGNTSLLDGKKDCPTKCLIGGTNAVLWLQEPEVIIKQIKHDLDVLSDHNGIVITSGGVMPQACPPETIKKVGDWLKNYPIKI
jgi:uroporphyrinogen-III decarboxylase